MRRVSAVFAAPVAAFLCMAYDASGQSGTNPAVLSDGAVEIRFAPPEDGLGCAGIVNRLVAGERFVDLRPQGATLWEILLRDAQAPTNEPLRVNNRAPAMNRVFEKSGGTARLFFEGVDLPGERRAIDFRNQLSEAEVKALSNVVIGHYAGTAPDNAKWRIVGTPLTNARGQVSYENGDIVLQSVSAGPGIMFYFR